MSDGGRGGEIDTRLAERLAISRDEAYRLLSPVWDDFMRGRLSEDGLWQKIESAHGGPIAPDQRTIRNTWEHMAVTPEMQDLVTRLRREGCRVGLLSNVTPPTAEAIRAHGGYGLFDFSVLSCEVGRAKPAPEIYELAMRQLPGITPAETVFVDDLEKNLAPARALGMQTVHATETRQVVEAVEALASNNA